MFILIWFCIFAKVIYQHLLVSLSQLYFESYFIFAEEKSKALEVPNYPFLHLPLISSTIILHRFGTLIHFHSSYQGSRWWDVGLWVLWNVLRLWSTIREDDSVTDLIIPCAQPPLHSTPVSHCFFKCVCSFTLSTMLHVI